MIRKYSLTVLALGMMLAQAWAATVTVNTPLDELNGTTTSIAALIASPGGAGISLREAVVAANNTAGADTINLTNGTYTLTRTGNDATSANGDLDINDSVTINGAGPATTIIQGATDASYTGTIGDKVLGINQDGTFPGLTVNISGVTIRYGNNSVPSGDPTFAYTGGGVDVYLTGTGNATTFSNCVITGNQTTNSYGGGVNVDSTTSVQPGGTVRFIQCNISNNKSKQTGGGINLFADIHDVVLNNCVITNNTALGTAGDGAQGGGISIRHTNGGAVTVSNNTLIANNTGRAFGGGVCVSSPHIGPVTMRDSTISGNICLSNGAISSAGGGLYNDGRETSLINMNISNNHSDSPGSGASENPEGGGICNDFGNITLSGTCVLTNNTSTDGAGFFNRTTSATGLITGATISRNQAKNNGGGINVSNGVVVINGVTIQGNAADSDSSGTGNGGGIYVSAGTAAAIYCRIVGNTAVTGRGIARIGGTTTATNSWWATNNAPAALISGTVNYTPWIVLAHTASPTTLLTSGTTTLTASFVTNSAGTAIAAGNLLALVGVPVSFTNSHRGSISGAQPTIQAAGNATATFNAGPTGGVATADAVVDGVAVTTTFTVQQPPSFTFCQTDITSNNAAGLCSAVVTYSSSATGYPNPAVTFSTPSGSSFPKGATAVTATASNGVPPIATCIFTVTVVDAEAPSISCPADVIATEDPMGSGAAHVKFLAPGASDLCSGVGTPVVTPQSDSLFPVGTNIVTNIVADLAGNMATCTFNVIVRPATNDAFRVLGVQPQANDLVILWTTPGGRTNVLQVDTGTPGGGYSGNFVDVTSVAQCVIAPLGDTTTNVVIGGGVTSSPARYYRIRSSD